MRSLFSIKPLPEIAINQINKFLDIPLPYPTMHHSEQTCAHSFTEWCIVGYGAGALWYLRGWSIELFGINFSEILNIPKNCIMISTCHLHKISALLTPSFDPYVEFWQPPVFNRCEILTSFFLPLNWKPQPPRCMVTSSNGNIFRVTGPLCGEFTKGQWRGALMFSLICAWINDWVNNREAGHLRRYRTHYDVIVMEMQNTRIIKMCSWRFC